MMANRRAPAAAVAAAALALPLASGCSASAGAHAVSTPPARAAAATTPDPVLATAIRRYHEEASGGAPHTMLARLAQDQGLRAALRSGSTAQVRAYVARAYPNVWYHWHVSRLRITRGRGVLAEAGVPFVVAGPSTTLPSTSAGPHDVLHVSGQDVIGYVRYMHRNYGVDVVVRGQGPGHVRTSLPAAVHRRLPDRGDVTIGGRRYRVVSFHERGWGGEPLKIWILR